MLNRKYRNTTKFKELSKLSIVSKDTEFKGIYIKMFGKRIREGNNQK